MVWRVSVHWRLGSPMDDEDQEVCWIMIKIPPTQVAHVDDHHKGQDQHRHKLEWDAATM